MFIGDATGHGVPAALVTATSFAFYNLIEDSPKVKNLLENPAKLLEILNKAIHAVGGKVLMTLFVGVIDKKSLKLTYSNASHDPPLLYRKSDEKPSKQDIEVLMGESGNRLGHILNATYKNSQVSMKQGDVLMLTTDGIIEGKNPEGKEWGDRNFMKTFLNNVDQPAPHIVNNIVKSGYDFFNGIDVGDDVTLVAVKIDK
ncbi:MAG: PP2C family protein-serine/threonine phosphatase [Bacteriovoracaceae bacterium]